MGIVATQLLDRGAAVSRTGSAPGSGKKGQTESQRGEQPDQKVATRTRREPDLLQARQATPSDRRFMTRPSIRVTIQRIQRIQGIQRILWVGHVRKLADCHARYQRVPLAPMHELIKTLTARGLL